VALIVCVARSIRSISSIFLSCKFYPCRISIRGPCVLASLHARPCHLSASTRTPDSDNGATSTLGERFVRTHVADQTDVTVINRYMV